MDSREQKERLITLQEENSNQQNHPINVNRGVASSIENFLDPQLQLLQYAQSNPALQQQLSFLDQMTQGVLSNPSNQQSQNSLQVMEHLQQLYMMKEFQQNMPNQNIMNLQYQDPSVLASLVDGQSGMLSMNHNLYNSSLNNGKDQQLKQEDFQQGLDANLLGLLNSMPPMYPHHLFNNCFFQNMVTKPLMNLNAGMMDLNPSLGLNGYQDSKEFSDQKIKRKHIKKQHNPQYNTGHWTSQEHTQYMTFLTKHKDVMESPELKKTNKIFKLMSDIIKTRSPSQCRSHHQKFNPFSKYNQNVKPNKHKQNVVRRKMKSTNDSQEPYPPLKEDINKLEQLRHLQSQQLYIPQQGLKQESADPEVGSKNCKISFQNKEDSHPIKEIKPSNTQQSDQTDLQSSDQKSVKKSPQKSEQKVEQPNDEVPKDQDQAPVEHTSQNQ